MSFPIAATSLSLRQHDDDPTGKVIRPSADFPPTAWGDYFVNHMHDNTAISLWRNEAERLEEQVRKMFTYDSESNPLGKLDLIDVVQRLGIAYRFEGEIEQALGQIFHISDMGCDQDLRTTGVYFRLLREHGYHISCDVFNQFKDKNGCFEKRLVEDVPGMLSLYEAAHLRMHEEEILDEAIDYTKSHLESMVSHLKQPLSNQVIHALDQALYRGIPRLEAYRYISFYQESESHNEVLLKLAKLDFNILQQVHREELSIIAKWWKDLDFNAKLPFVRDRIAEVYFWILGTYFEPQYGLARRFGAKVTAMITAIDDIYDAYGTKEELELFTEAVNRWDSNVTDDLPEYMKWCYRALLDVYSEMEEELEKEGASYRVCYAKEAMKASVRAYYEEFKCLGRNDVPTMEEYMKIAIPTGGYRLLTASSYVGMGDVATKEAFDWLLNPMGQPKVLYASTVIARLMDDIQSHKFEQERKHVPSAVECYMNQFGVTEQKACSELKKQVEDAWKTMNQEFLGLKGTISRHLLARILNLTRAADTLYKHEDIFTNSGGTLKNYISSLLVHPLEI